MMLTTLIALACFAVGFSVGRTHAIRHALERSGRRIEKARLTRDVALAKIGKERT